MEVEKIMQHLEAKHPGELEFLQAVREVLESIKDVYNQHPELSPSASSLSVCPGSMTRVKCT